MRINTVNKLYILIFVILATLAVIKTCRFKPWDRYFYFVSATSPASYPIHVRNLYMETDNPDDLIIINKENTEPYAANWGEEYYFIETNEKEQLPKQLIIQYLDFRSKLFYKDTLALPTDEIRKIFKDAAKKNDELDIYYRGGDAKGLTFLIGIANEGHIIVWLRTKTEDHIVLKTKLTPKQPNAEDLYYDGYKSFKDYYNDVFADISDSLKLKFDSGWDRNAKYIDSLQIPKP
ncbi:DUF2931 family protein [Sphingobacterium sp. DK4209]|uniref:DUF2931 family protein n=1 Tax=Sphingobacterium zhuxiongii TaxID=2662364 RepID=A0A5Q0QB52_9SPHI|nr:MULTISPECIES: DUF2931 family protein [unclassified Sphingobacterium]MVZ67622.1 DUF2931 family protein [Sphingobacterium sp. DK4209]QGA27145.1 DUF2931 family protein [Sphingobacterium sp. dk4302]